MLGLCTEGTGIGTKHPKTKFSAQKKKKKDLFAQEGQRAGNKSQRQEIKDEGEGAGVFVLDK